MFVSFFQCVHSCYCMSLDIYHNSLMKLKSKFICALLLKNLKYYLIFWLLLDRTVQTREVTRGGVKEETKQQRKSSWVVTFCRLRYRYKYYFMPSFMPRTKTLLHNSVINILERAREIDKENDRVRCGLEVSFSV